jgi:phosphoglycerate dehydrogenase-like enzyme
MKPGAVLCNVGRGSLVDEAALIEAVRTAQIRAAILDVFEQEPLPPESPLWSLPGVHVSPHCSVSLDRYGEDVMALFLENLGRLLRGEPLRNVVTPPD